MRGSGRHQQWSTAPSPAQRNSAGRHPAAGPGTAPLASAVLPDAIGCGSGRSCRRGLIPNTRAQLQLRLQLHDVMRAAALA